MSAETLPCDPVLRHGWDGFTLCTQNCVQRYYFFLTYANIFCILHEISMKLQKTYTKKIEKTATRVAVFNL